MKKLILIIKKLIIVLEYNLNRLGFDVKLVKKFKKDLKKYENR